MAIGWVTEVRLYNNEYSKTTGYAPVVIIIVYIFMPRPLGMGGIRFYICPSFGFCSVV